MSGQVDRTKVSIEAKERAEDDIRRDVEIAKLGAENALVERVRCNGPKPMRNLYLCTIYTYNLNTVNNYIYAITCCVLKRAFWRSLVLHNMHMHCTLG